MTDDNSIPASPLDRDDGLANERTGLAWQRTALSWVAAGSAVGRHFSGDGLLRPKASMGWLMIAVGALIWFEGGRRYHRQTATSAGLTESAHTRPIQIVWLATVAVAVVVLAIEIANL